MKTSSILKEIKSMDENDKDLMKKYGVTCSPEVTYHYKGYQYKKLKDALNYAKIDLKKNAKS